MTTAVTTRIIKREDILLVKFKEGTAPLDVAQTCKAFEEKIGLPVLPEFQYSDFNQKTIRSMSISQLRQYRDFSPAD